MGLFGIGTYQPIQNGTPYQGGFLSTSQSPVTVRNPFGGVYGGTYGYVLDTTIRAPQRVGYTPAPEIGTDGYGRTVIRGYPQIVWSWGTLRPDRWMQLLRLYQQSARTPLGFQFLVLIQYPDPLLQPQGTLTRVLARLDPPTHGSRDVGSYQDVTLKFTYVGLAQLNAGVPIQVLS